MFKVSGWLKGHHTPGHAKSLDSLSEFAQIQDAMAAVTYIMADDIESAEAHLNKGSSPFHQLGAGVCVFMRATLGFEPEIVREAANALYVAENSAYEQQRRASKDPNSYRSAIYPPGTEYAVCMAEAQLMSAVVGVLNESLTEAVKSFYKLRKAYLALEGVMENEKKFLNERSTSSVNSIGSQGSSKGGSGPSSMRSSAVQESKAATSANASAAASTSSLKQTTTITEQGTKKTDSQTKQTTEADNDDDFEFVDAAEDRQDPATPLEYMGHVNVAVDEDASVAVDSAQTKVEVQSSSGPALPAVGESPSSSMPNAIEYFEQLTLNDEGTPSADIATFSDHPVDVFVLSGSNFCFGMLLLILSFIPPSFASLLKIVGFKGDRERGMRMLWQATKFHNIHGAMAGVVLMGYLNGFTNFCDIIPAKGEGSYPREKCLALLRYMRARYPQSHLWLLEESRMLASEKQLEKAVEFMAHAGESKLKQLEALSWFERSLNNMYMHDYEATASGFEKCISLNNWSHGLYYHIIASAYVELYRRNKTTNPTEAKKYGEKAEEYMKKVIPNTGKKKFMARQLPFDVFVSRKIQKWEARAKEWNCNLVDAVGVSPLEEMIYFWNGYKRMRDDHLEVSLANLAWSESSANPYWEKESVDEKSILNVLRAATLRNMSKPAEAKALLEKEVLPVDRALLNGNFKDNWTAPCARYEMAANIWREAEVDGHPEAHPKMLAQCKDWLEEVTKWGSYDLDARIGMKVTTGKETLRKYGIQC
ncbi:mitochondrial outer membrane protein iml2 [Curvularia clavata]|uniref:Inclusion body clearance protein IML2 n=1 Tax=Curvularia clavata TaxID=95742 RepID=A0A9Q8Z179_CURCL|nr:mitochondrial outer membrane protein iml2 [Curvularia clavata]